jgi:hypothetical protein
MYGVSKVSKNIWNMQVYIKLVKLVKHMYYVDMYEVSIISKIYVICRYVWSY